MDYEFIKTITSDEINGLFPETDENEGDISNSPEYDIDLYRINYTSIFLYDIVTLSGLIVVPQKTGPLSHMQYHHGTLYPYTDIPGESLRVFYTYYFFVIYKTVCHRTFRQHNILLPNLSLKKKISSNSKVFHFASRVFSRMWVELKSTYLRIVHPFFLRVLSADCVSWTII